MVLDGQGLAKPLVALAKMAPFQLDWLSFALPTTGSLKEFPSILGRNGLPKLGLPLRFFVAAPVVQGLLPALAL